MAELEVSKHGKKALQAVTSHEHTVKEKAKEFAIEIIIIVFAVTLSIWLHSLSEKYHEKHEAKEFLIGLKTDLQHDIEKVNKDIEFIKQQQKAYKYLSSLQTGEIANQDTINAYQKYLYKYVGVQRNSGRYEGFKSSGKLSYIENEQLEDEMLDLYEEINPTIEKSLDAYNNHKTTVANYIVDHSTDYPGGNYYQILSSNPVKMRCRMFLADTQEVLLAYEESTHKMTLIVDLIKKKYDLN